MKVNKRKFKGVEFHIESDDYFGTLATVLDLLRQDLDFIDDEERKNVLLEKVKELVLLQKNYRIVKK